MWKSPRLGISSQNPSRVNGLSAGGLWFMAEFPAERDLGRLRAAEWSLGESHHIY